MTGAGDRALLPAGLQDLLAPAAAHEAATVERLIAGFATFGYERVKPPLLEFEEALLTGAGASVAQQTFRLMDPVSQRMMALRADITPQVARIAATRLAKAPRPLRLCYGGQVLRIKGTQLRPERQFGQAGAELIGAPEPQADAEVVVLAADALTRVGVGKLSVDLSQPTLVGSVARGLGYEEARIGALRQRLDRKDAAGVAELAGGDGELFLALLGAAGPAAGALDALSRLALPEAAQAEVAQLARVVALVQGAAPELTITVDPVEHRGFEYQTGVSFTLFARDVRGELGRGGRYVSELPGNGGESSTGFTLYMDTIMRALPSLARPHRVYLPAGCPADEGQRLRAEGWITLAGFAAADAEGEARRLGCSHLWRDGTIEQLADGQGD